MSDLIRLVPAMYVLTPLGEAEAHFLQVPHDNDRYCQWGCFQLETKENWWWDNTLIRLIGSISARRGDNYSDFYVSNEMFEMLLPHILRHKKSPLYERANAHNNLQHQ
jgi:hypothetical protein